MSLTPLHKCVVLYICPIRSPQTNVSSLTDVCLLNTIFTSHSFWYTYFLHSDFWVSNYPYKTRPTLQLDLFSNLLLFWKGQHMKWIHKKYVTLFSAYFSSPFPCFLWTIVYFVQEYFQTLSHNNLQEFVCVVFNFLQKCFSTDLNNFFISTLKAQGPPKKVFTAERDRSGSWIYYNKL